jgi:hypothetical protein
MHCAARHDQHRSLVGVPAADARRAPAELADASLLAEHRPGRYIMHDLVRGYAAAQARRALGEAGILGLSAAAWTTICTP